MDVCVTEAVVIKSTKGSDIVFYLEIHCGHWIWENVKTYPEIAALHTKVSFSTQKSPPKYRVVVIIFINT